MPDSAATLDSAAERLVLSEERTGSASSSYGVVMVVVAALAMVATLPGRTHGLGMVTERLLDDPRFGLTRTGFGWMNFWATILGGLFCLGSGQWLDNWGIRRVLPLVLLALGAVVLAMTVATGWGTLFVLLLLTRGCGQSALSVVSISIVGKWFSRRVGLAMAAYSILLSLGFIGAALLGREYATLDWRQLWGFLGVCVLMLAPFSWLVSRDPPGDALGSSDPREQAVTSHGLTWREALATPAFWLFAFATSLFGMLSAGISLFNESILGERGFPAEVYYDSLALATAVGLVSKLLIGPFCARATLRPFTAAGLVILSATLVWLTQLQTLADVRVYVLFSGCAGAVITVIFFMVWRTLYGSRQLGTIQGIAQMLTVLASALGPALFAETHRWSGSYAPLLWSLAAITGLTAVSTLFIPLPREMISGACCEPSN